MTNLGFLKLWVPKRKSWGEKRISQGCVIAEVVSEPT